MQIANLIAPTTCEGAVLIHLMDQLKRMRDALGHDQAYDGISSVLDSGQVRLDTLIRDSILKRRSLEEILAEIDVVDGEGARAEARTALSEALATPYIDMAFIDAEQRVSKERRLTPEYVEHFFVDAPREFGGRITPGGNRDWRLELVPAEIRRAVRAANIAELGLENRLVTSYKERLREDPPAELMAPGHPLFDVIVERVLAAGRPTLTRGTAFVDWSAREPYRVWLHRASSPAASCWTWTTLACWWESSSTVPPSSWTSRSLRPNSCHSLCAGQF